MVSVNYDCTVTFKQRKPIAGITDGVAYRANVTQMGPDEALKLFGDAKQRPFIVRLPFSTALRSGFVISDSLAYPLQIVAANQLRQRTTLYGVEYHGQL